MSDTPEKFEKRLTVTECEEYAVWSSSGGKAETVLYDAKATDENGEPWEPGLPLRSFALLEVGVPQTYTCSYYTHKKSGEKSITLKRPRHNTTEKIKHLEDIVADLAARVSALETRTPASADALPDMPKGPWGR